MRCGDQLADLAADRGGAGEGDQRDALVFDEALRQRCCRRR